jgi:hypothetical protein
MEKTFLIEKTNNFLADHKVNEILTEAANEMVRTLPENPWLLFIKTFDNHMSHDIIVKSVRVVSRFDNSLARYLEFAFALTYKTSTADIKFSIYQDSTEETKNGFLKELRLEENPSSSHSPKELQRLIAEHFEGKEIHNVQSWNECINSLKTASLEAFEVISDSFHWFHYQIIARFEPLTLTSYCNKLANHINLPSEDAKLDSLFTFVLFKKVPGPQRSSKSVYFTTTASNNIEHFRIGKEFFDFARNELSSNKATNGKFMIEDGCITSPFDSLNDTTKFLSDILSKFPKKDFIRLIIDVDALENLDQTIGKFTIDGAKKPLSEEEFEDTLAKIFIDKKTSFLLLDPFPLTMSISWHRFNKKVKDKNLTLFYGTKFGAQFDAETFSKLDAEDVPGMKPDLLAKIQESRVVLTEAFMPLEVTSRTDELIEKIRVMKEVVKMNAHFPLPSVMNELKGHYYGLAREYQAKMIVSPTDCVFLKVILNNNF